MARSRYDDLHDQFWTCSTTKSGTRYERLSAFVVKALQQSNIVIHDIKLTGDADVSRQIDVSIQDANKRRRVLIECKDYDISGNKVGLDVVDRFCAVIQDIQPDEAIIITCNGFTKDAQKVAKKQGIKLVILREFQESDRRRFIREIHLAFEIQEVTQPKVKFLFPTEEDQNRFSHALRSIESSTSCLWADQPIYLHFPDGGVQLHRFVEGIVNRHPRHDPGPVSLKIRFVDTTIDVEGQASVSIGGIEINFEVAHYEELLKIASKKIARLIFEGFGGGDLAICDDDLTKFTIDETTGEVIPVS